MILPMRILILTFLVFLCPFSAGAQNTETPKQETSTPAPKKIFEDATDHQIREAQAYYNFCSEDETYSRIKDCNCSAAEFLDVRVTMGNNVKQSQILDIIKNKCLLDDLKYGKVPLDDNPEEDDELNKLTDKELKEVEEVFQGCKADFYLKTYRDCECIAAKFLDQRQELGPFSSINNILAELRNDRECINTVDAIGKEYSDCMENSMLDRFTNAPRKKFCECVANDWVTQFESYKGNLSSHVLNAWSSGAITRCVRKFQ